MKRSGLLTVAAAWLLSRVWLGVFAYAGHFARAGGPLRPGAFAGVPNWWLNVWTTYDSQYFLSIAARGYSPQTSVFFPLYPLLMRAFGPNPNALALVGIVVSNAAFFGALWLLFDLTRRDYDEKTARLAVWVLALFPCAVYSGAVYTESLWLLLALLSFRGARSGNWMAAGLWGALAALTRNAGPVLALALLVAWWQSGDKRNRASWLWALLPALSFVAMQFYFRARFGGALASVAQQKEFGRALVFPLIPLWRDFVGFVTLTRLDVITVLNWSGTLLAFVLAWRHRRVQPRSDAILLCGVMFLNLLLARTWPPYTTSSLRYLFGLWPFSQLLALELAALRPRSRVAAGAMGAILAACTSFLFGAKEFLG